MSLYTGCMDLLDEQQPALSEYDPDWLEPANELKRIQDFGSRVDHQPGEGKDKSDARASAAWHAGLWEAMNGSGVDVVDGEAPRSLASGEVREPERRLGTMEEVLAGKAMSLNEMARRSAFDEGVRDTLPGLV